MNRSELIKKVAKNCDYYEKDVSTVIRTMFDLFEESLLNGQKIKIAGFGSFDVETKPEREGYNPKKNEHITIPERRIVKFKPSKKFKERIKEVE